ADPGPKIDVDKENAVRQPQPVNVRHGVSIAPRTYTSREEPTVREALTVATRFRRGCPLTESPRVGARPGGQQGKLVELLEFRILFGQELRSCSRIEKCII